MGGSSIPHNHSLFSTKLISNMKIDELSLKISFLFHSFTLTDSTLVQACAFKVYETNCKYHNLTSYFHSSNIFHVRDLIWHDYNLPTALISSFSTKIYFLLQYAYG